MRSILVVGGKKLEGTVSIGGSKNSALPILAATLLISGETELLNIPNLNDVITMIRVLRSLGARAEYCEPNTVRVWTNGAIKHVAPYELVTKMRASFFVIGPVLARMGLAKIPLPGGCAIGSRPVNLHLKGLEMLGAKINMEHGFVIAKADRLRGNRIYLDFPSVGATETLIMAASLAEGETLIENAAQEPEIVDLANFLIRAGAKISGHGTDAISIKGVTSLKNEDSYKIISDRVEAGSFMVAAAVTRGHVVVKNIIFEHIEPMVTKLKEAGVSVTVKGNSVVVQAKKRVKAIDVKTMPFPGFPTDVQPQFCSLLATANGTSVVSESIFENRFMHIHELKRMGAKIRIEGRSAIIEGIPRMSGAPVVASDLRAGAALVIAGLAAKDDTIISDVERHIERGYENFAEKLCALGAEVKEII